MTYREVTPKTTPLDYLVVVNAVLVAGAKSELNFSRAAAKLLSAQIAIETGLRSCPNYCIAGEKAKPNNGLTNWQYFATRENFDAATLARAKQLAIEASAPTPKVLGTVERKGGKAPLTSVMLYPKHPWCCFVAFGSLDEAVAHHLNMLRDKFAPGLEGLLTGDAEKFASGLQHGKFGAYFTALRAEYVAGLKYRVHELESKVPETALVWGDVQ
jgi:hypothetical protein